MCRTSVIDSQVLLARSMNLTPFIEVTSHLTMDEGVRCY